LEAKELDRQKGTSFFVEVQNVEEMRILSALFDLSVTAPRQGSEASFLELA
jgi:hypothetical protein